MVYYIPNVITQIATIVLTAQIGHEDQFLLPLAADAVASAQALRITRRLWKSGQKRPDLTDSSLQDYQHMQTVASNQIPSLQTVVKQNSAVHVHVGVPPVWLMTRWEEWLFIIIMKDNYSDMARSSLETTEQRRLQTLVSVKVCASALPPHIISFASQTQENWPQQRLSCDDLTLGGLKATSYILLLINMKSTRPWLSPDFLSTVSWRYFECCLLDIWCRWQSCSRYHCWNLAQKMIPHETLHNSSAVSNNGLFTFTRIRRSGDLKVGSVWNSKMYSNHDSIPI